MNAIDWSIVSVFCLISIAIGLFARRRAGSSIDSYFASGRRLGWWLAGTSIVATAFSSDTPLLVTGMVRRRGIWGVWEVWALGISTMLAVFVFSKLWKRANVLTEVELVELRYSGSPAAFLRGFKALYWGLFYNCYVIGVWPVTGMTKVLQEITGFSRADAIIACVLLGTTYTSVSGLWGVVLTDAFQFLWAMTGAVILAFYSVHAVGGLGALAARLRNTAALSVFPPLTGSNGLEALSSPFGWFLGLLLIQWWAWKNTDGGGVVVQRLVSCKNERQAMLSVLWFNVAHYCLRSWPWIITALASLVLVPDQQLMGAGGFIDHERAYPRLITLLLPTGMRGILVAAFFAAFLSTISTLLNWGSSYLLNDGYKRFINRKASERHYLAVARLLPFLLSTIATVIAFNNHSIGESFTWVLNLTAGIGPVYLLRWFWWRINPWSEIAAMIASVPVLFMRGKVFALFGWPHAYLFELLFMVLGTTLLWLPVTLATPPVDRDTLNQFYARVKPPGLWGRKKGAAAQEVGWVPALRLWLIGTVGLLAATVGPLQWMVGSVRAGLISCLIAAAAWTFVIRELSRQAADAEKR